MRSIVDYSAIAVLMMTPNFANERKQLEIIQNKAMRLITSTRQVDHIKITTLQNLTALSTIEDRSIELEHKYLNQTTNSQHPNNSYHNNGISAI
eukprot:Pgem_evm1s8015